jgi:hypothetical protein
MIGSLRCHRTGCESTSRNFGSCPKLKHIVMVLDSGFECGWRGLAEQCWNTRRWEQPIWCWTPGCDADICRGRPYGMASTATEIERPTPLKSLRAESARWVPLAFAAVYILWGSTYIGIRIAIESFPPLAMAAIRHSLVGLILYPILRIKTGIRPTAANWWTASVTGVSAAVHHQWRTELGGTTSTFGDCGAAGSDDLAVAGDFGLAEAARYASGATRVCGAGTGILGAGAAGWSGEAGRFAAN